MSQNYKSENFLGVPVRKSQNPQICMEKNSVSDPDQHWFASNTFFYQRKYNLDYETPCKPKFGLKFD
jgi:hypothetical protein